jgi:adenylate cyclase
MEETAKLERRLAAIMAIDAVGYSRLMEANEEATHAALKSLRQQIIDPSIKEYSGRIVKSTGDGLLIEFASAVNAVSCAVAIQRAVAEAQEASHGPHLEFRIGVNLGDIIIDDSDIYGDGVNIAARLEASASPNSVHISGPVYDQVRSKLPYSFTDLGEQVLKNISMPVRIYRCSLSSEHEPNRFSLPLPGRPSIAVLPFNNMSGDVEQDYFADGITEDVITALSKWRWFFVIARNSSFTYKGRAVSVAQVGKELGVQYVLEGSVRKSGNRIRITAQLVEAASGKHIWADRFDNELIDVFEVQDAVTRSVAAAIEPALARIEVQQARAKSLDSLAAWDHYLRGHWHFHQFTKHDAAHAIGHFNEAIRLNPDLADAYVGLARTHFSRAIYLISDASGGDVGFALKMAQQALALDDENIYAYYILSLASAHVDRIDDALWAARRATELNGNFAQGYFALAVASCFAGLPEDALTAIDLALRLSPNDPQKNAWLAQRASTLYLLGRYAEAIANAVESRRIRWFHTAVRVLAASYAQLDQMELASSAVSELLQAERGDKTINDVMRPFRRKADRDHYAEGLRKAGLPDG